MSSEHTAAHQLQAMEKELESFAYSVAHDLHAPLRAILHFSKMLDRRAHDKLDSREQDLLRQIPELAGKAQGMLDALLHYSRLGQPALQPERIDLTQLAQQVGNQVREKFPDVSCTLHIADALPDAHGDRALLERLLLELISNALQFNDHAEREVRIGFDQEANAYFVCDNGIGMSPSGLERAPNVFCRLHREGVYGDGLGMGLSVASKIVRLHHGHLWLTSTEEEGTCAYFQLEAAA